MTAAHSSHQREAAVILLALVALIAAFALNLTQGEIALNWLQLRSALSQEPGAWHEILMGFRLPRATAGLLCGMALAVCGALMQGMLRNPMASPGVLGVSAGSHLAILLGTLLAPEFINRFPVPVAMTGGLLAVAMVYGLCGGKGASPMRVLLAGLVVGMSLGSLSSALQILFEDETRFALSWGAGSLRQNGWNTVATTAPFMAVGLAVLLVLARQYDVALLGKTTAQALGQNTARLTAVTLVIVLLLSGAAVALTGPIGFIGLMVPHLIRFAGVRRHRALLPACALTGAALLLIADCVVYQFGAMTSAPPVGAITAVVGVPFLLWQVWLHARKVQVQTTAAGYVRRKPARRVMTVTILMIVMLASMLMQLLVVGHSSLSPADVLHALLGQADPLHEEIVWILRMPRIVLAALVGASLALAGLLMQSVLRNPLADPSIIGVNTGATLGILLLIQIFPGSGIASIHLSALGGAFIVSALVMGLAWRRGFAPLTIILCGICLSAICGAFTQMLVLNERFNQPPLQWLVGGLYAQTWEGAFWLIAPFLLAVLLAWVIAPSLDMLALGDEAASAAGLAVPFARLCATAIAVVLTAASVSVAGPIGYIGLLAPHMARYLCAARLRSLMPATLLLGSVLLILADWLGRIVASPAELPAGAVITLVGAPCLIFLIYRSNRP